MNIPDFTLFKTSNNETVDSYFGYLDIDIEVWLRICRYINTISSLSSFTNEPFDYDLTIMCEKSLYDYKDTNILPNNFKLSAKKNLTLDNVGYVRLQKSFEMPSGMFILKNSYLLDLHEHLYFSKFIYFEANNNESKHELNNYYEEYLYPNSKKLNFKIVINNSSSIIINI